MDAFFTDFNFWHWLLLGVVLLLLELTSGSGFLLWIAFGSALTSVLAFFFPNLGWEWLLLNFAACSVITCVLWWRYLKRCTEHSDKPNLNRRTSNYIGRILELENAIENGRGKVRIADSFWIVEGEDLPVQTKVKVVSVDGTILKVVKAPEHAE